MSKQEETLEGIIRPLELSVFKHRVSKLKQLRGPRPVWDKEDRSEIIEKMRVIGLYPHIVVLAYRGRRGDWLTTSLTWAQALLYNRMTKLEYIQALKEMNVKKGIGYPEHESHRSSGRAGIKYNQIDRNKYIPLVMECMDRGMNYKQTAEALDLSRTTVSRLHAEGKIARQEVR